MRVEILHVRNPDSECELEVWIDGEPVEFTMEDIDPGRGYVRSEWDQRIADARTDESVSAAFRAAVVEALEGMSDNKYIEDHDEDLT